MFKNLSKSFLLSLLVAASLGNSVFASEQVEEESDLPKSGRFAGFAKNAVSKLPSSHLTLAVGSEIATDLCPSVVTTTVANVASQIGLDTALSSLSTVSYMAPAADSLSSISSPIYKFALEETAFFGGRLANRIAGNAQKALTWGDAALHAVRGGVAVAAVHYATPFIVDNGVELVKTYISASLSSGLQTVGLPVTQEMIETTAPYVLKASLFLGAETVKWGVSFASSLLKKKEKKD